MKYCPSCKTEKPKTDFYNEPNRVGGLSSNCKECKNARSRAYWKERYYPAHKQEVIDAVIEWRKQKKRN